MKNMATVFVFTQTREGLLSFWRGSHQRRLSTFHILPPILWERLIIWFDGAVDFNISNLNFK